MVRNKFEMLLFAFFVFFCGFANAAKNIMISEIVFSEKNGSCKTEEQKKKTISGLRVIINNNSHNPELCIRKSVSYFLTNIGSLSGKNRDCLESLLSEKINMYLIPAESFLEEKREMLESAMKKRYPISEIEYRRTLEQKAIRRYRLIKIGDRVRIYCKALDREVSGRYTGMSSGNRGAMINGVAVPFYDMTWEEKAMFSATTTAILRKNYVRKNMDSYAAQKSAHEKSLKTSLMKSSGYILCGENFFSPREYITHLLETSDSEQ